MQRMKSVGVIMDVHGPFEHKRRYDAMLNAYASIGLDALYIIGDFLDFYCLHGHGAKHPLVRKNLLDEIEWGNRKLDEIEKTFSGIPLVFIEGNHEWRLERYIVNNAPALFGVTEIKRLLKMDQRPRWKWHSYGPRQLVRIEGSDLFAKHDPGPGAVLMLPKQLGVSLVHGHTHRRTFAEHRTLDNRSNRVFSGGWLGDERNDLVFGYVKGHHLWNAGFVHAFVEGRSFQEGFGTFDSASRAHLYGKRYG
jgi:UDP-2,3-diacylglucosamine pyrophosphatase LpxH